METLVSCPPDKHRVLVVHDSLFKAPCTLSVKLSDFTV